MLSLSLFDVFTHSNQSAPNGALFYALSSSDLTY